MKPIATVHWSVNGKDHSRVVYTEIALRQTINHLEQAEVSYCTCLMSTDIKVPTTNHTRVKGVGVG